MPPWGRPPGGLDGRRPREGDWERERERERELWERAAQGNRFQEVYDDEDDTIGVAGQDRYIEDNVRYGGFDLDTGKRRLEFDEGLAYGEDYRYPEEPEGDYYDDPHRSRQLRMREREEELVDAALRRIRRANLRGEANVDLTREELDALERRQLVPQLTPQRIPIMQQQILEPQPSNRAAAKPKRKSSGNLGQAARSSRPSSSTAGQAAVPVPRATSRSNIKPARVQEQVQEPSRPSSAASRSSARNIGRPSSRQGLNRPSSGTPPLDPQFYYNVGPAESTHRRSSRGSPARSLPDDPAWMPRTRSSSSTQLYSTATDPYGYQVPQRRHVSGPAGLSHPVPRRPVHLPGATGTPGMIRMPLMRNSSSDLALGHRVPSGLSNEVIEISSDEDDQAGAEEVAESEDDEDGVRVDVVPSSSTKGYTVEVARPPGGRKLRKGRR